MIGQRRVRLKNAEEIAAMRRAGQLLDAVFGQVCGRVRPGVTTLELDQLARELIEKGGASPAFLGYRGFPNTLCTSINEQVVHGIPAADRLQEGDVLSIDCGVLLDGFYADKAVTLPIGEIAPRVAELIETTREALEAAIDTIRPGKRLGDLGRAVEGLADAKGFGVVRQYTGHGIGRELHEPPQVPNYFDPANNMRFQPGMVVAIEPMINLGTWECEVLDDQWTVVTRDRQPSAHFEDTVAVTEDAPWVLTRN